VRFTAEKNFSNASGVNVQMADDSGVTLRGGWRKRGVDQQLPRWRYCLRRPSVLPQAQVEESGFAILGHPCKENVISSCCEDRLSFQKNDVCLSIGDKRPLRTKALPNP